MCGMERDGKGRFFRGGRFGIIHRMRCGLLDRWMDTPPGVVMMAFVHDLKMEMSIRLTRPTIITNLRLL